MKAVQTKLIILSLLSMLVIQACNKAMVVKNVDYSQQIETVLVPNDNGIVTDIRHGLSYSILPFQYQEFKDTTSLTISEVRMIRDKNGYYFITADQFKHVYIMEPKRGELVLKKKVLVDEKGLLSPAFNWREPVVQLIDRDTNIILLLNEKGIFVEEVKS